MGVLIISAGAAGFLWAIRSSTVADGIVAGAVTSFVVVAALVVESLATSAEKELGLLIALLKSNSDRTIADIVISDEKMREILLINDMLTTQNSNFRGRLLIEKVREQDGSRRGRTVDRTFPLDGPMS